MNAVITGATPIGDPGNFPPSLLLRLLPFLGFGWLFWLMALAVSAVVRIRSIGAGRVFCLVMCPRFAVPDFSVSAAIADLNIVVFVVFDPFQNLILTVWLILVGQLVEVQKPRSFTSRAIHSFLSVKLKATGRALLRLVMSSPTLLHCSDRP